ncbi:MAG: hypothetical protein R3E95_09710 [Thiolinea sp.]
MPDKVSSFASTQAAWRFYANESVTLPVLQAPLTASAQTDFDSNVTLMGCASMIGHGWPSNRRISRILTPSLMSMMWVMTCKAACW